MLKGNSGKNVIGAGYNGTLVVVDVKIGRGNYVLKGKD